jgi:isocitrate lyase
MHPFHAPYDGQRGGDAGQPAVHWPDGNRRLYGPAEVARLRGSIRIEHTLARRGAQRLRRLLKERPFVRALGAMTGGQAVQMAKAGLEAIYLSGWQVAADANLAGETYPDQSLYPANSGPALCARINRALLRHDRIEHMEGRRTVADWGLPIVADAEAGFGGALNAFEVMRAFIEAGAAGVHFEDQLASEKKCGHLGGKVLVPASQFIRTLNAARLAADVEGVPSILIARTDAHSARLLVSDVDPLDAPFLSGERTPEGFLRIRPGKGVEYAIARGAAYAPWADLIWWETAEPDIGEAREFAEEIARVAPGKMLAYNCSPSFNWRRKMDRAEAATFQERLAELGYRFQFVTLAGFHSLNHGMFRLACAYARDGMGAYSDLQQEEFAAEAEGFTAVRHQREVGTSWFDAVALTASGGMASTTAMAGSTETEQFGAGRPRPSESVVHWVADGSGGAMPVRPCAYAEDLYDDGLVHGHAWARTQA